MSPDGRFYGCHFYRHDEIAYALIRKSPFELEDAGWLRVHTNSFRTGETTRQSITSRQQKTILELGFEEAIPGSRRTPGFVIDRTKPAPTYAVKPPSRIANEQIATSHSEPEPPAINLSSILARLTAHSEFGAAFKRKL